MAVLLGFLLLVIPAIYIYSFIKPEKFNVRTGKNPNGYPIYRHVTVDYIQYVARTLTPKIQLIKLLTTQL